MVGIFHTEKEIEELLKDEVRAVHTISGAKKYTRQVNTIWITAESIVEHAKIPNLIITEVALIKQSEHGYTFDDAYNLAVQDIYDARRDEINASIDKKIALLKDQLRRRTGDD